MRPFALDRDRGACTLGAEWFFPDATRIGVGLGGLSRRKVRAIFEPWQLAECLETARQAEPINPVPYDEDDDPETVEDERQEDIRRSARDLLLVERVREWLLGDGHL